MTDPTARQGTKSQLLDVNKELKKDLIKLQEQVKMQQTHNSTSQITRLHVAWGIITGTEPMLQSLKTNSVPSSIFGNQPDICSPKIPFSLPPMYNSTPATPSMVPQPGSFSSLRSTQGRAHLISQNLMEGWKSTGSSGRSFTLWWQGNI